MSQNATQQELIDTQEAIAQFAERLTTLKNEAKYQEILQSIEDRQELLKQQIQEWDNRSLKPDISDISKSEAIDLRDEIARQESRYTQFADQQRLQEISNYLKQIIQGKVDGETNAKIVKQSSELAKLIGEAKSIGQMFDNYKHLQSLDIRTHADLDTQEIKTQLSLIKDSGLETLLERIRRELAKCNLVINKLDEYNQRKNVLQQLQVFMPISEEFNSIRHEKEIAAKSLDKRGSSGFEGINV